VDWYIPEPDAPVVSDLRAEIGSYLRRHGSETSDFAAADLIVSELLTNAIMHANDAFWVSIAWDDQRPLLEVHDLGPGFTLGDVERRAHLPQPGGRGLFIASSLADSLAVRAKARGGSKVSAVLPVERPLQESYDPTERVAHSLPDPIEAEGDGLFGKESFLRALVVQLAESVEHTEGPAATERAVAEVGARVGGRMEESYRQARSITGKLSTDQIADLYVRLKAAIQGDFYVIEVTDDRIVLGNRRCPFGEVVQRAPGLCRMTSSVFGGIAARSSGRASVSLEERIAVGDHECRVVVWLHGAPPGVIAHHYGSVAQTG
jgi:anti-sigma regulatory factor (Ser/Thr protein kinase)/predicted ArsR family transcriptional regulator